MENSLVEGRRGPPLNVAVACGGTGGHVFPGLATARALLRRGHRVTLWLTGRETEQAARQDWEGPVVDVPARGLPGGLSWQSLPRVGSMLRAVRRSRQIMQAAPPDVLLAMGSYASVGPCGAARWLNIPYVLHEANVIPGRAVRLFARAAAAVAVGFEETQHHLQHKALTVVGIPLREELTMAKQDGLPRTERHAPFRLLAVGGSLGARRLNEVVVAALLRWQQNGTAFAVTHLTGPEDEAQVRAAYQAADVNAEVMAFTRDMAPHYRAADIAICRAGAVTCAELTYFGVPALFVPYPLAAGDHQTANARALEKRGAADVVAEANLTPEWLAAYLAQTARQPERLAHMRAAMQKKGVPDASEALATLVEQVAQQP